MDRHTTTTLSPGRPSFWVLVAVTVALVALLVLATDVLGSQTPSIGDWEIDDVVIFSGAYQVVTGNITVRDGGSLQMYSLSLDLNISTSGQYHVAVEPGGRLTLEGVTVDSLDRASFFNITVSGSASIANSTIRRMDGPITPNPLSNPQGLVIESSSVSLTGSTIRDCRGFAVTVEPGGLNDVSPLISGCRFLNNGGGVYCGGVLIAKANARITSCTFSGNDLGDVAVIASDPTISDCSFTNSILSWGVTGVTVIGLASPTIEDCTFSWFVAAVISLFSDPVIRDCTITWSAAGITVIGDDPLIDSVTITNTITPMNLTGTYARVVDCTIDGFMTGGYAVVIDSGQPEIERLTVELSLFGGAISMVNDTSAVVTGSLLSGSGILPVVAVEDSRPTFRRCSIVGGTDGVELVDSPAVIEDCAIQENTGWGIISYFEAFTRKNCTFGSGSTVNDAGRVLQLYQLEVWVEHEDGRPAVDATVTLSDAMDDLVDEVATDAEGFAFGDIYPEYEVTNANRTITYAPYTAEARLGELVNVTSFGIEDNPVIVLVLRPVPDLPPVVEILSPADGGEYDVWELGNQVPFRGVVRDPEGGVVTWEWYLDGEMVNDQELEFELVLAPGPTYEAALVGVDEGGQETRVYHNFTVVSVPPEGNHVEITSPVEGAEFDMGEEVLLACEYYVLDHPELEGPVPLPLTWESDVDGLLIVAQEGTLTNLTPGEHVLTVYVWPRYPEFIPEPYTDRVTIVVLAPEPVAFANISSPANGTEFRWDVPVPLAAEGSYLDIYDPPDYRTIYRWSSDIDGLLGEGLTLDATHLQTGVHVITLLLTTDPFIAFDEAVVTIIVHPDPNRPPVARVSVLMDNHTAGEPLYLTARLSADPDGDVLTYLWDLGDGNVSEEVEVNHTYAMPGNYTVVLTVFDGELEGSDQVTIEVAPASNGGNGDGNGGNGDGDDDGKVETADPWVGWLFIVLLFAALGAMLLLWYRGRERRD